MATAVVPKKFREMAPEEKLGFISETMRKSETVRALSRMQPEEKSRFGEKDSEVRKKFEANLEEKTRFVSSIFRNWEEAKVAEAENHVTYVKMAEGIILILTNGRRYMVPMIIEEASVISGVANAAKMNAETAIRGVAREIGEVYEDNPKSAETITEMTQEAVMAAEKHGGFWSVSKGTITSAQVQVVKIPPESVDKGVEQLKKMEDELIKIGNSVSTHSRILSIRPRKLETWMGTQIIVDFDVDCGNAQGAAVVSKMAEAMQPWIERITDGEVIGRVLTNDAPGRLVVVDAIFDKESLALNKKVKVKDKEVALRISGEEMVERILYLSAWAEADPKRAPTHNKGIMNGIVAVGMALRQDTRALESGAHSYAAIEAAGSTPYRPLSYFRKDREGNLHGHLEIPIPVGTVGGTIETSEVAKANMFVIGCESARELAEVMGAIGLAQNLAALKMLAGEGITSGHGEQQKKMREAADVIRA